MQAEVREIPGTKIFPAKCFVPGGLRGGPKFIGSSTSAPGDMIRGREERWHFMSCHNDGNSFSRKFAECLCEQLGIQRGNAGSQCGVTGRFPAQLWETSERYEPRLPDFDDVACGFPTWTRGGFGADPDALLSTGAELFGFFREKSGIDRFPFFFIVTPERNF